MAEDTSTSISWSEILVIAIAVLKTIKVIMEESE